MAALDASPLWAWVNERHAIYIRKGLRSGLTPDQLHVPQFADLEECDPGSHALREAGPYTDDPILAQYRFCNVFRELDRVTVWIDQNIRKPFADHPDLWLMLAIARYINWPDTLQTLIEYDGAWPTGDHGSFSPGGLGRALDFISSEGRKVYTGAYMIRAESNPKAEWYSWTKQQYVARIVIGRLWEDREQWRAMFQDQPEGGLELQAVWQMLQSPRYIGWGPFMAYQAVVDMRWCPSLLGGAPDINTWAALGPGSRRGLNRLAGRPLDFPLSQAQGLHEMRFIYETQNAHRAPWVPVIDLSDIQNALCETDKYLRVKQGEGRPRAQYVQGRGW